MEVETREIPPADMKTPFTSEEVQKDIHSLKNGESAGIDETIEEQLRYGFTMVYKLIADILNETAETGNYPDEIKRSILVPLQKTGKKQGQAESRRSPPNHIPLHAKKNHSNINVLHQPRRIEQKIDQQIPLSQVYLRFFYIFLILIILPYSLENRIEF